MRCADRYPVLPILSFIAVLAVTVGLAPAQPGGMDAQGMEMMRSLDSLQKVLTLPVYTSEEKKAIRECDREKSRFLKALRDGDSAHTRVDKDLMDAKLNGANPGDPKVIILLEKKFELEKTLDTRYLQSSQGKGCRDREEKRNRAISKILAKSKEYRSLKAKLETRFPSSP